MEISKKSALPQASAFNKPSAGQAGVAKENIIVAWCVWHFYEMPKFLLSVWENYISFALYFFSLPLLLATLFSPWKKYSWNYPRGFNIAEYFNILFSNLVSRIIGAVCRLVLILFGIIVLVFILLAGIMVMAFWLLLPFIAAGLATYFFVN